jgi:hypothetical protein
MKKRISLFFVLAILANLAFAAETDAEILKDLDFFSELDVFREGAVFDEIPLDDDAPSAQAPAATAAAGGSHE